MSFITRFLSLPRNSSRRRKNGKIKDFFPRRKEVKFASKKMGSIDFKSTNYIHNVKAGEVVCRLTPPEPPEDGVDIFGNTVYGKAGIMPPIPQGKNVIYNEEKDKLITACEGNLSFRAAVSMWKKILNISGNVDNSVGNIDFTGSVSIKGDVLEDSRSGPKAISRLWESWREPLLRPWGILYSIKECGE